jgi:6-phosphofructokinase 2
MPAIITITFSPCIDKSTSVSSLIADKKLRCSAPRLEPGGGGINVARAIKKLGGEAQAIFPAGGYMGKQFIELINNEKIDSVIIETEQETRENIIVFEEFTNRQFRLGMPGTILHDHEWKQILNKLDEIKEPKYIVASGSLPPGVPPDIFSQVGRIANIRNAKFIVDTSGEALKYSLSEGVYLIKPNLAELGSLINKDNLQIHEIAPAAQQIIESGYCEVVITSMGAAGAMLVTKEIVRTIDAPTVQRKSTVGAGDSMVAGIVFSLSKGNDIIEAAEFGVACGTAATMNEGTELCRLKDVEQLYNSIHGSSAFLSVS